MNARVNVVNTIYVNKRKQKACNMNETNIILVIISVCDTAENVSNDKEKINLQN